MDSTIDFAWLFTRGRGVSIERSRNVEAVRDGCWCWEQVGIRVQGVPSSRGGESERAVFPSKGRTNERLVPGVCEGQSKANSGGVVVVVVVSRRRCRRQSMCLCRTSYASAVSCK